MAVGLLVMVAAIPVFMCIESRIMTWTNHEVELRPSSDVYQKKDADGVSNTVCPNRISMENVVGPVFDRSTISAPAYSSRTVARDHPDFDEGDEWWMTDFHVVRHQV